jgi:hypothetical protein
MLDKLGAVGAIVTAAASPCCFPLLAAVGTSLGLASIPFVRDNSSILIQAMTGLSLMGQLAAYRQRRVTGPLLVSAVSSMLVAFTYHARYQVTLIYFGLAGLTVSALWNFMVNRPYRDGCCSESNLPVVLESVLTCPFCSKQSRETMPTDACLFFYDCPHCDNRLKPKPGDCCVFCSYGTVKCPPIQLGINCGNRQP